MPPWQRKCLMAPDPAISRLACDALSVVWVATSQLVTQSRCRTVNSSPVNSSHLCLVKQSTRHTTKPSDAGEIVPRNSCSTWTVCRQEDIQEGVTGNKSVMTWKTPNIWQTKKIRDKLLRKYESQLTSALATTSSSRLNQRRHLLIPRRQSNLLWYLPITVTVIQI